VAPTFRAAYYSVELKSLVIRFSESISVDTVDLDLIKVHAAGKDPVALGSEAKDQVDAETLKITDLSDDAHKAIADVGNPQVDIGTAAVSDLAGDHRWDYKQTNNLR
jgi:hypothetical protein